MNRNHLKILRYLAAANPSKQTGFSLIQSLGDTAVTVRLVKLVESGHVDVDLSGLYSLSDVGREACICARLELERQKVEAN